MQRDSKIEQGLPWPEAFEDILPAIREQWGVEGRIYLSRKLSGKSGALVYCADLTTRDHAGQAILKLEQVPEAKLSDEREADRHHRAAEEAPEYAAKHLPKVLHTLNRGDKNAILSSIAGRGLEYSLPFFQCGYDQQLHVVHEMSQDLLEDWNAKYELAEGGHAPQDLLASWLDYRLDPKRGRIHAFLAEHCGLQPSEPSFTFEGHWYPNPLVFAQSEEVRSSHIGLRVIRGNVHGDLHGYNVLAMTQRTTDADYYLIDLAKYEAQQYLFYDHAYFELAYLLQSRGEASPSDWESIIDRLSHFQHEDDPGILRGDDLGLIELVRGVRREVFDWVDRHESNRISFLENQYLLAQIAAGLGFTHKDISRQSRQYAFIYGAATLKDYLRLNGIDWPKHGPQIVFRAREERAPEISTAPSAPAAVGSSGERSEAPAPAVPAGLPLPEKPAVAVLAFQNLSEQPDQEYFADGVTEEVITYLSRIESFMVLSPSTTFIYKGLHTDPVKIGKELGVHYVVEGSVRRSPNRVRVNAKLIDALNGRTIWADRFDGDLEDIFDLQDEIARSIVSEIDLELKYSERKRAKCSPMPVSVWEKFQKGMWHFYRLTAEDTRSAGKHFSDLIDSAPAYAPPYAALAILECRKVMTCECEDLAKTVQRAFDLASKAVALDDDSSLARHALARALVFMGRYDQAVEEAQAAVALNPSSSEAHLVLGLVFFWSGRAAEGVAPFDTGIRLSPKGSMLKIKILGKAICCYFMGQPSEAEAQVRRTVHMRTVGPMAWLFLAAILVQLDRLEEARLAIKEAHQARPDMTISRLRSCWAHLYPDYLDRLTADLRKAGMAE